METQTRLSRHNKFISAENIVGIFSVYIRTKLYINKGHPEFFLVSSLAVCCHNKNIPL